MGDTDGYFDSADVTCMAGTNWLGNRKPCIQYGLRGLVKFHLNVTGPKKDLHSGHFGGSVHEPMIDCVRLMATLVDSKGKILVPGVLDSVAGFTYDERTRYSNVDFPLENQKMATGVSKLIHEGDPMETLQYMWRYPSLSMHGIEGAHAGPGSKTVIPGSVTGKFSIRTVPWQDPTEIISMVTKHLEQTFFEFESANTMVVTIDGTPAESFEGDPEHPNYQAASRATE